ncbi:Transmembrane emp24 domain-containing protein eca, partial [Fragariocoptes setiger]
MDKFYILSLLFGLIIVTLFGPQLCESLYFHIGETEKRCFIEEIPDETLLIINYKLQLHDPVTGGFMQTAPGLAMHVDIRDPEDKVILTKVYQAEGKVALTSHKPGEHVICINSNSTKWFAGGQLRVHFDIRVGEHAVDYSKVAETEKYTQLQLRIRQLQDQVEQTVKELNYQRYREEMFRATSESTSNRVFYWSILQLAVVSALAVWQSTHLKRFFEAKKLV